VCVPVLLVAVVFAMTLQGATAFNGTFCDRVQSAEISDHELQADFCDREPIALVSGLNVENQKNKAYVHRKWNRRAPT